MNGNSGSAAIGKRLRVLRRARDLSQESIATRMRALGYTGWLRQTVGLVERGRRRLIVDEVLGLSLALDVPLLELLEPSC